MLRVLLSGHRLPCNQGLLNFEKTRLVTVDSGRESVIPVHCLLTVVPSRLLSLGVNLLSREGKDQVMEEDSYLRE